MTALHIGWWVLEAVLQVVSSACAATESYAEIKDYMISSKSKKKIE